MTRKKTFQIGLAEYLLRARETHDHRVKVTTWVDTEPVVVYITRKSAFMAAVELLLACSVVGKADLRHYFKA